MSQCQVLRLVYDSGLRVLCRRVPASPLVHLEAFFIGGAALDPPERAGRTNLMVRTLRKGTLKKTGEELENALESRGADLSFSARTEGVAVHLSCLSDDLSYCLSLLKEMLTEPAFSDDEVAKEKNRQVDSLRQDLTRPEEVSFRLFQKLAYPDQHPYRKPVSGEPETVSVLGADDCRAAHKEAIVPERGIIAIAGDVDPALLADAVHQHFASLPPGNDSIGAFEVPNAAPPLAVVREREIVPDRTQCWVTMGHPGLRRTDPLFYPANVLTTILGAGWGRLFTEIRDNQGLAYAVGAGLQAGLGPGPFFVRMGINPKDLDRAVETADRELRRIVQEPPDESEIEDAKNYIVGRLVVGTETTPGLVGLLLTCELYGLGLDYPERVRSFYDRIGRETLAEVAGSLIFPDRLVVAVAGP